MLVFALIKSELTRYVIQIHIYIYIYDACYHGYITNSHAFPFVDAVVIVVCKYLYS